MAFFGMRNSAFAILFLAGICTFGFTSTADALPAFSKKYSVSCTLCHDAWPMLNKFGYRFKINGFQMPDGRDGTEFAKSSPDWNINLDAGGANPPLSLRLQGGINVFRTAVGSEGDQGNKFACCSEPNTLGLYTAGTVGRDAGYFANFKAGENSIEQGYVRFVNLGGQSYFSFDLGAIKTSEYLVESPNREWFSQPNGAYLGNESLYARARGMVPGHSDSGLRMYGNPNYGPFSYELVYVNGSRITAERNNGKGEGVSALGRMDTDNLAISLMFWQAKSGILSMVQGDNGIFYEVYGGTSGLTPNAADPDEVTTDLILNVRYGVDRWFISAVYDSGRFEIGSRQDSNGYYTRESIKRNGLSLAWIYRFSGTTVFGARYTNATTSAYEEIYAGTTTQVDGTTIRTYEFKFDFTSFQNARVSLQLTLDDSDLNARKSLVGGAVAEYQQQNKLLLLWDWAI